MRYSTQTIAVTRLPGGADPQSLAWIDARLQYLESLERKPWTWPVKRHDVRRAIGYCRQRRFSLQAGQQVEDLNRAITAFWAVKKLTPPGARDEMGVNHDLAMAVFDRARLLGDPADYQLAHGLLSSIRATDVAARLAKRHVLLALGEPRRSARPRPTTTRPGGTSSGTSRPRQPVVPFATCCTGPQGRTGRGRNCRAWR